MGRSKEALLADDPDVYFTTLSFDGYPAILLRLERITGARVDRSSEEKRLSGAPQLAIEVLSSDRAADAIPKFSKYAAAGLERHLIVDPKELVSSFTTRRGRPTERWRATGLGPWPTSTSVSPRSASIPQIFSVNDRPCPARSDPGAYSPLAPVVSGRGRWRNTSMTRRGQ